ncbi:hypothetical protein FHL15_009575 [Xylaria flabelliformis]|uniref:2EXR domain-containing protein n=1 Tax=Xylaria flabelliformis TaxID=2512241 RepID=A0A553HNJ2_9PEZI|nr:hypothetical protein FHL15_009575 [Xylaria flabelliformis]
MKQMLPSFIKALGATSFTKFRELPPELRIKIWEFAMPDARTIIVKSPYTRQKRLPASLDGVLPQVQDEGEAWQSPTQVPALLHVNAEARHEALKHYSLSFGVGKGQPRVYVDFDRDTIFFGVAELQPDCSSLWADTHDLDKVRRLAIVPQGAWRALRWKKVDLNSLEKLIFVHDPEEAKPGDQPQLIEDEQSEPELSLELERRTQQWEIAMMESYTEPDSPKKQRIEEAREEFATLKMILLAEWEKEPTVSTAIFEKAGDT